MSLYTKDATSGGVTELRTTNNLYHASRDLQMYFVWKERIENCPYIFGHEQEIKRTINGVKIKCRIIKERRP